MNTIFLFFVVAVVAVSALPTADFIKHPGLARVLTRDEIHDESGQFALLVKTENGITISENGWLIPSDEVEGGYVLVKKGMYSYYTPANDFVEINWTADKEGFVASGDAIPKAPLPEITA